MKGCASSEEQHIFLIKRNWFSDRIYNWVSDKPTDLHTHTQMSLDALRETNSRLKPQNIELTDSCRTQRNPSKAECIKGDLG